MDELIGRFRVGSLGWNVVLWNRGGTITGAIWMAELVMVRLGQGAVMGLLVPRLSEEVINVDMLGKGHG